jgi:dihydrofolate reductase
MRKLVASEFVTVDGVFAAPGDWQLPYFTDELGAEMNSLMEASDALLFGRHTYQEFAPHWSTVTEEESPGADYMNAVKKYVVSTTLQTADWTNTTIINGDTVAAVKELKSEEGQAITLMAALRCCKGCSTSASSTSCR